MPGAFAASVIPEVRREQGLEWVVACIDAMLPVARENDIILGLENHYKDGFWKYPEFAQKKDVFSPCWPPFPNAVISAPRRLYRQRVH